jgi:hypothetical protein
MKFRRLSATLTATVISLIPGFYARAIATEPNYLCFFTTSGGEVVDLSDSICHSKKSKADKAFIEAYKSQAMKHPDVRDNLIANIESSSEDDIEQAKGICKDLRAGLTLDEIQEDQTGENSEQASVVKANIISDLATQYYCPDMSN